MRLQLTVWTDEAQGENAVFSPTCLLQIESFDIPSSSLKLESAIRVRSQRTISDYCAQVIETARRLPINTKKIKLLMFLPSLKYTRRGAIDFESDARRCQTESLSSLGNGL